MKPNDIPLTGKPLLDKIEQSNLNLLADRNELAIECGYYQYNKDPSRGMRIQHDAFTLAILSAKGINL